MKTKDLIQIPAAQLEGFSKGELKDMYAQIRDVLRHRKTAFEAAGQRTGIPARYRQNVPRVRDLKSESELRSAIREASAWMRGKTSTVSGYEAALPDRLDKINQDTGLNLQSQEDVNRFSKFMGEVRERYKEMKYKPSDDAIDLFEQAMRLNMDENMLLKNFDYWADHIEDLREAEPINSRADSISPGRYRAALGLETIKSWKGS